VRIGGLADAPVTTRILRRPAARTRRRSSLDEVLALRHERAAQVGRVVDRLDDRELHRSCRPRDGRVTVVGALQTVMFEEWAHHRYATRDLARLDAGAAGGWAGAAAAAPSRKRARRRPAPARP